MKEKKSEEKELEKCVQYFKQYPVYETLFAEFRKKYISLGGVRGSIRLEKLTKQQREELQGFMPNINPFEKGPVTVSFAKFGQELAKSRFGGISPEQLLEAYFGKKLITREQKREQFQSEWDLFFERILENSRSGEFVRFLTEQIEERKADYVFLKKLFKESPQKLEELLICIEKAIERLPEKRKEKKRLPIFAAEVTGNPHYFDVGTDGERMLRAYIKYRLGNVERVFLTEEKWEQFYQAGIIKDDLSNEVLTFGIKGKNFQGEEHQGMLGFAKEGQPLHVSLRTLGELSAAYGQHKKVFIVENPAVFEALIDCRQDKISAVCTSGQLRLAALVLLDMLAEEGHELYYAGDFDPEGLQIADKLKRKYQEHLNFWLYEKKYYEQCVSSVMLNESRLKLLDHVKSEGLKEMAQCIREQKHAGYQEGMVQAYIDDVK